MIQNCLLHEDLQVWTVKFFHEMYIYIWVISWEIYSKHFFFGETFFLPFHFENNRHVFFFQCDTWKFRDIFSLSLALGNIFFFQQLTVKAVLNIKCNSCTRNARKSTSFQKSYSSRFKHVCCNPFNKNNHSGKQQKKICVLSVSFRVILS